MPLTFIKLVIFFLLLPYSMAIAQQAPPNIVYDTEPQVEVPNSRYFSVAFIDKTKRLVFINSGEAHGINKGDRVCILDQTRVKIGCFRIRIINKTSAAFKPSKKKMMKINSGMVARFAEDEEQLDEDFEDNKTSYLEMGLVFSPLLPHSFNQVVYLEDKDAPGTLRFVRDEPVKSNFTQAYIGTHIQFSASFGLASGLLARSFAPMTAESDLGTRYPNSVAVHRYTVVGFGMPFLLRWVYGTGNTQLVLSEGLQWDMTYLRYRLYSKDADEEETLIVNHFSLLNTVSLKAEIGASFKVGLFSRINATLGFVLPVGEFSEAKITEYGNDQVLSSTQKDSLIQALDHKKSHAGVDLVLSFGLGF